MTRTFMLPILLLPSLLAAQEAGEEKTFEIFEGLTIEMVWIPAGTFTMGNTIGLEDRFSEVEKAHLVKTSRGFWMAKHETTQALWEAVMSTNPSSQKGGNYPVTDVSWHEVMAFFKIVQRFDTRFDLPTEAQWEHAAKAGTNKDYSLPRDEITWHKGNSGVSLHPVGTKKPNRWGLYDIHGNAGEWTKDWKAPFTSEAQTDPTGPETGERKLIKGGQFTGRPRHTLSFDRQSAPPPFKDFYVGFRVMRTE